MLDAVLEVFELVEDAEVLNAFEVPVTCSEKDEGVVLAILIVLLFNRFKVLLRIQTRKYEEILGLKAFLVPQEILQLLKVWLTDEPEKTIDEQELVHLAWLFKCLEVERKLSLLRLG